MSHLDELLRDGLRRATDTVQELPADQLALRLQARRAATGSPAPRTSGRPRALVAALVALAVTTLGALGWAQADRDARTDVVVDEPSTTTITSPTTAAPPPELEPQPPVPVAAPPAGAVEQWAPGWYRIDGPSLPALSGPAVWFRGELHVTAAAVEPDLDATRVFRRDRDDGGWSELPPVQLMGAVLVAAGDQLVAVGEVGFAAPPLLRGWVVLAEDGSGWRSMGTVRPEPTRASGSYLGPRLVWTGERVLDTTGAAVLDPVTGATAPLEVPDEERLVLTSGTTVWTGDRAVLATWGPESGDAWDALGRLLGELPPADDGSLGEVPSGEQPVRAAVVAVDGTVLAVAAPPWSGTAAARRLPPGSDRWEDAPSPPAAPLVGEVNLFTQCRSWLGNAGSSVLSLGCNAVGSRAAELRERSWVAVGVPELLGASTIDTVDSSEHAVTIRLSVPPPPELFAGPADVLLVWVPSP
jgi:hypothetical protein